MQVEPIKPLLKAPGTKRLKLKFEVPLSNFAFKFNIHHYTSDTAYAGAQGSMQRGMGAGGLIMGWGPPRCCEDYVIQRTLHPRLLTTQFAPSPVDLHGTL